MKRAIYFIGTLLTGLTLLVLAKTVLHDTSSRQGAQPLPRIEPVEKPPESPDPGKAVDPGDSRAIAKKDPFRTKASGMPPAPPGEEAPVMPAELRLSLKGTIVGCGKTSFAIISGPETGKQGLYGVGDRIQEARITEIRTDRVLLTVKGALKTLYIETSTPDPASIEGDSVPEARRPKGGKVTEARHGKVQYPKQGRRPPGADLMNVGARWTR